jgi:hypothetical protein
MRRAGSELPSKGEFALRLRIALALSALLLLNACAGASLSVGLQSDGRYVLERSEQTLDCDRLYKTIWGRIQLMKTLPERAKAEMAQTPQTALSAFGRIFGGQNKGLSTIDEYDREAAHVDALHRAMLDKGCPRIDLERELADAEFAMSQLRNK